MADDAVETALERRVRRFIVGEMRMLDEWRLEEWLSLWLPEGRYWLPSNRYTVDPSRQISIIYDDFSRLTDRVVRLTGENAHAQEPRSRTTHFFSGLELRDIDAVRIRAHIALLLVEVRKDVQEIYAGRVDYDLVSDESGQLRMAQKRVVLTRNDSPLGNLTFLI